MQRPTFAEQYDELYPPVVETPKPVQPELPLEELVVVKKPVPAKPAPQPKLTK